MWKALTVERRVVFLGYAPHSELCVSVQHTEPRGGGGEVWGWFPRQLPLEPIPGLVGRGQGMPGESDNPVAWPCGPAVGIP